MVNIHAALQRGFQVIQLPAASGRLLRLGLLGLPATLLVVGDWDIGLLGHLLLLGRVILGLLTDCCTEADDLVEDHVAHLRDVVDNLEVEVKGGRAARLVRGIVPDVQVRVLECLLNRDTRGGVEGQHAVQQVQSIGVGIGEKTVEGNLGHEGKIAHIFLCAGRSNAGQGLFVGGTQIVQDLVQLVDIVTTLEEGTAA